MVLVLTDAVLKCGALLLQRDSRHVLLGGVFALRSGIRARRRRIGLKALIDPADPTSAARETLLQQIAWNAVAGESKRGAKGQPGER